MLNNILDGKKSRRCEEYPEKYVAPPPFSYNRNKTFQQPQTAIQKNDFHVDVLYQPIFSTLMIIEDGMKFALEELVFWYFAN